LYDLPRTRFVATFVGQSNMGPGTVLGTDGDHLLVDVLGTKVRIPRRRSAVGDGDLLFGVRPEKVKISRTPPPDAGGDLRGIVKDVSFLGVATSYLIEMPSGTVWSVYEQNLDLEPLDLRPGDECWISWDPGHAFGVPLEEQP
jgi:spermidine/putrescine transport system ATP-binding protein